ncbi:MAG: hypothetical protein H6822_11275 [Planctomycetaceae bacterium]|nr:hypothetical protein [Planctomycetales bacterium]MCB9922755.1 hypothetical protein [Planctomycetaceae bacterium]
MSSRNRYDGLLRSLNRKHEASPCATDYASASRRAAHTDGTGRTSGTPRCCGFDKALVFFAAGLFVLFHVERVTCATEPGVSVEQSAFAIDSTKGLLAVRHSGKFLGARSCAASACHGGVDPDPRFPLSQRNEYVTWLDRDPHSRSHRTLDNELSQAILSRLARPADDDDDRARRLANCLGCHNPQPEPLRRSDTYFIRDGVSCEMCHGAAEQWIGPHVTAEWPRLKQSGEAITMGFIATEDRTVRAETCVACHVGSPGREVNHDLIAAGHPALKFELTAYYAMLPKHWRDTDERRGNPQLEVELWQAGQVACAKAAVELLKWRATRAADEDTDAIWPEFAEYDCYACHHDLVHPSWRQTSDAGSAPLGMAEWGSWYFNRMRQVSRSSLEPVETAMQSGFRPEPAAVIAACSSVRFAAPGIQDAVRVPKNWDDATQQYLALVAWEQAQRDAGKPNATRLTTSITNLRQQLAFPEGHDSPMRLFESGGASVTRDQVHQSLLELMRQIQQRGEN